MCHDKLLSMLSVLGLLVAGPAAAQDTITLAQCLGDRSLPVVAELAQQNRGLTVAWQPMALEELRVRVVAEAEQAGAGLDGIWGCPAAALEDLVESDFGREAFLPAESYARGTVSAEFYVSGQRWFPVTIDVGVACVSLQSPSSAQARAAIESDPWILLGDELRGRAGIRDPLTSATGYDWIDGIARKVGYQEIERFARELVENGAPFVGGGCRDVAEGRIEVALSNWFDASSALDAVDVVVPAQAWAEPYLFAVLAKSGAVEAARALLETLASPEARERIMATGEVVVPLEGTEIALQTATGLASTNAYRGPAGRASVDNDAVAAAAAQTSIDGCKSNFCGSCPRRCRLCGHCR
jgi:hypothetical protein